MHGNTLTGFRANICYSDDLAHKLNAAADAFLMPSRSEPCGLTQLISFRYGTVPIVVRQEVSIIRLSLIMSMRIHNMASHSQNATTPTRCLQSSIIKHIFFDKKREWNQIVDRGMANYFSGDASSSNMRDYTITLLVNKIFW